MKKLINVYYILLVLNIVSMIMAVIDKDISEFLGWFCAFIGNLNLIVVAKYYN